MADRTFRRTFITGLLVVTPLVVTYWLVSLVYRALDNNVTPLIFKLVGLLGSPVEQGTWLGFVAPVVGIALSIGLIYGLGLVGGNVLGRQILKSVEALILQVPVVRGIYSATRQFIDTFSRPEGRSFHGVVLVQFPHPGVWSLGLVTNETAGEVPHRLGKSVLSVFVPTTPNPTSGYLVFAGKDEVKHLDMSIDDAFKMIVSGGVLTPAFEKPVAEVVR